MTEPFASLPPRDPVIFTGATVLTMDADLGDLRDCDIEVVDGAIRRVGTDLQGSGASRVDARGMTILPGLVDTHTHVWGTFLRDVVGDGPDSGWFATKTAFGPHIRPEDTYASVRLGMAEMLMAGVTTVHDWAHNVQSAADADANLAAHLDSGARVHFTYGSPSVHPSRTADEMRLMTAPTVRGFDEAMGFDDVVRVRDQWVPRFEGRLTVGVNLRGPARSALPVVEREFGLARDHDLPIAMHCAGTRGEVERIQQVEVLAERGLLGPDMLLAHCLYLTDRERQLLAHHRIPISLSPASELRLAMGMPSLLDNLDAGIDVSLSHDTLALTGPADPFAQMRLLLGITNTVRDDAVAASPLDLLRAATISGAKALGLDSSIGSITPGKRADLIMLRTDVSEARDPATGVLYGATPREVDTVMVDGRLLLRRGALQIGVVDRLRAQAREALDHVQARSVHESEVL